MEVPILHICTHNMSLKYVNFAQWLNVIWHSLFFYSYVFDMCLYYEPSLVYQSKRERHVMISLNLGTFQIYIVPCRSSSIYVPAVNRNHTIISPRILVYFQVRTLRE